MNPIQSPDLADECSFGRRSSTYSGSFRQRPHTAWNCTLAAAPVPIRVCLDDAISDGLTTDLRNVIAEHDQHLSTFVYTPAYSCRTTISSRGYIVASEPKRLKRRGIVTGATVVPPTAGSGALVKIDAFMALNAGAVVGQRPGRF